MQLPTFPIFSMKHMNNKTVAGGGGGDPQYGKKNGILIFDNEGDPIAYFATEDTIRDIQVMVEYDPDDKRESEMSEDFSMDGEIKNLNISLEEKELKHELTNEVRPVVEKNSKDSLNEGNKEGIHGKSNDDEKNGSNGNSKDGYNEKPNDEIEEEDLRAGAITPIPEGVTGPIYICASGFAYFYFLRLDHIQFTLLHKQKIRFDFLRFCGSPSLIVGVSQDHLYSGIPGGDLQRVSSSESSWEDYMYMLGDRIIREDGSSDIPGNWHSFYTIGNRIYKVVKERNQQGANVLCFVFNGKKYYYDAIKSLNYDPATSALYFYTPGENSQLNIIDSSGVVSEKIKRITCLDRELVGTGDGKIYSNKKCAKVDPLPITGVSMDSKGVIYFSTLSGTVGRATFKSNNLRFYIVLLSILMLIIALIIGFRR